MPAHFQARAIGGDIDFIKLGRVFLGMHVGDFFQRVHILVERQREAFEHERAHLTVAPGEVAAESVIIVHPILGFRRDELRHFHQGRRRFGVRRQV